MAFDETLAEKIGRYRRKLSDVDLGSDAIKGALEYVNVIYGDQEVPDDAEMVDPVEEGRVGVKVFTSAVAVEGLQRMTECRIGMSC